MSEPDPPTSAAGSAAATPATSPTGRSWYKKKRYVIPGVLLLILIVGTAAGGGDKKTSSTNRASDSGPQVSSAPSPRPPVASPSTKKSSPPKPEDPGMISAAQLGSEWPFTVSSGELRCRDNAITFTAGGKTYGVNGTATGRDHLPPIDPIWKPNPDIPGTKVNIGPVIDRGLALCAK